MISMSEVNCKWYERKKGGLVGQPHELTIGCVWKIWQWWRGRGVYNIHE